MYSDRERERDLKKRGGNKNSGLYPVPTGKDNSNNTTRVYKPTQHRPVTRVNISRP
jgi:hypothetical protein